MRMPNHASRPERPPNSPIDTNAPRFSTAAATPHVSSWSTDDVALWLAKEHGVAKEVVDAAKRNRVTGPLLAELDDAAWLELGVVSALKRAKLRLGVRDALETPAPPSSAIVHRIPIVNVFFDLLFDEMPPKLDSVKSTLDTIALLSALFLTIAMAIPASVDYDELMAARARFDAAPYNAWASGSDLVEAFALYSALSTYMLGSSLIATVVTLVSLIVTQDDVSDRVEVRQRFWIFARWGALWAILALVLGVVACFFAFNRLIFVKIPDIAVERAGAAGLQSPSSVISGFRTLAYASLLGTLISTFMLMGLGKGHAIAYLLEEARAPRPARWPSNKIMSWAAGASSSRTDDVGQHDDGDTAGADE